jgi:hypothetical protein
MGFFCRYIQQLPVNLFHEWQTPTSLINSKLDTFIGVKSLIPGMSLELRNLTTPEILWNKKYNHYFKICIE